MQREKVIYYLKLLNALDLIGLGLVMVVAFLMQFALHELPCPLCLLQRLGLLAMGFGFLLNVHYDIRPAHYSLSLLATVFTAFVALRQICLHVVPGSGAYGGAIFDLHLYTWVFILAILAIIYIAIVMSFSAQYMRYGSHSEEVHEVKKNWARKFSHFAFALFFIVTLCNVATIFMQCGAHECPDNPSYSLFK